MDFARAYGHSMNANVETPDKGDAGHLFHIAAEHANKLLSRFEDTPQSVAPKSEDCFQLMSSVGAMNFGTWRTIVDPRTAKRLTGTLARTLERLRTQLRRPGFIECLVSGVLSKIERVDPKLREIELEIENPHPGRLPYIGPDEFDSEIIFGFERTTYAVWLAQDLGLRVPPRVQAALVAVEQKIRNVLPIVAEAFRADGYPFPQVYLELFPERFWWRRVMSPKSLSEPDDL